MANRNNNRTAVHKRREQKGNRRQARRRGERMLTLPNFLISILFMLLFICVSVTVTLNYRQLYYQDIENLNIPAVSGVSAEDCRANYDVLIDYNSMFNKDELVFPTLKMSEHGKIHFEEVKAIFVSMQWFMLFDLVICLLILIVMAGRHSYAFLKLSGIVSVVIPAAAGAAIAANWNWFFITFHHIAFNNDYWLFDPAEDPVINILPDEFFMHAAIMIVVLILLFAGISFLMGTVLTRVRTGRSGKRNIKRSSGGKLKGRGQGSRPGSTAQGGRSAMKGKARTNKRTRRK